MTAGLGTLVYAAPEVWPADGTSTESHDCLVYNKQGDIYALALILHQLFGGGASFFPVPEGCHARYQAAYVIVTKRQLTPPCLQLLDQPLALKDVVEAGVDAVPSNRPCLEEFIAAIKSV
jgi:hypothetical protein